MKCVLLVLDEAAYIPENIVKDVMTPVLNVNNTAIVAVSTPGKKPTALFNRMTKNSFFDVCHVMFICQACRDKGVREICVHNQDFVPDHLGDNSELVKSIYGEEDDAMRARDVFGVTDLDIGNQCFTERSVRAMITMPRVSIYEPIRYVFTAVDPSAGSKIAEKRSSDFCIFSICGGPMGTVILAIDAIDAVVTQDYEPVLIEHIRKIRAMAPFAGSVIVLDAESGTGYTAGDAQLIVTRNFDNIACMNELGRKPGTYTSSEAKREMAEITRGHLDSGDIRIFDQFMTTDPNPAGMIEKFMRQMLDYERRVVVSESLNKPNTVQYTGKDGGKKLDDISQTFLRIMRSRLRFTFEPMYQKFHT